MSEKNNLTYLLCFSQTEVGHKYGQSVVRISELVLHVISGSSVMTVVAIDYDEGINGTVKYEIVEGPSDGSDMKFQIRESSGLIETSTNSSGLDRETTPTYTVKVKASDRGVVAQSIEKQVIINLDDKNDQVPVFEKLLYKVTMSEAQTSGAIARVRATDDDIGENARLDYRLNNFISYFDVEGVNNEGSIVVFRVCTQGQNESLVAYAWCKRQLVS